MKFLLQLFICVYATSTVGDASPAWWAAGPDPVLSESPPSNKGAANVGQGKWIATRAVQALTAQLGPESPVVEAIDADLFKDSESDSEGVFFPGRPEIPDSEWLETQRSPLRIGALKALAAPFYKALSIHDPVWLEAQLQANGLVRDTSYFEDIDGTLYPWDPNDDSETTKNRSHANIGQLKLAFSLEFATLQEVIRPGFNVSSLMANDDFSTSLVSLGFSIGLWGNTFTQCYVNNNGNITFDDALGAFTPFPLQNVGQAIVAPFWADVDTRGPGSEIVSYGVGTVNDNAAFGVNWVDVGYFNSQDDKLNSFQLVLIQRSDTGTGNFDIEFNYKTINWETGSASDGVNGFGGSPSRSGLSNGIDRTIELVNSGVTLVQLDEDPITSLPNTTAGLRYRSRNSMIPGRFVFQVRNGEVLGAITVDAGPDQSLDAADDTTGLSGNASVPGGGGVTLKWKVIVGDPESVAFLEPNGDTALAPTISFNPGEKYVLQLTATSVSDPSIQAADVMTINP